MALPLNLNQYPVTIANGTALSGAVKMGADTLVGIAMPAAWTTAGITFQVSIDDGATWLELNDDGGNNVTITNPAGGVFIMLSNKPDYVWREINVIKVRSGTASVPVNQTADRVITLIGRPEIF